MTLLMSQKVFSLAGSALTALKVLTAASIFGEAANGGGSEADRDSGEHDTLHFGSPED